MSAPENNQQLVIAMRRSRLAVMSLVLVGWAALSLVFVFLFAGLNLEFLVVCCLVSSLVASPLAFICGIAALVRIKRSRGKLTGRAVAIASVLVSFCMFLILFPDIRSSPGVNTAKATSVIRQLSIAGNAYNTEYGRLPQPCSVADFVLIFAGLRDPRTGGDVCVKRPDLLAQNPQRLPFIDFRAKDVTPPHWATKTTSDELAFYDPWGTPYGFAFDNGIGGVYYRGPGANNPTPWPDTKAGDGVIPLPFASADGGTNVIRAGCAFFSNGPDGLTGTPETEKDDIRSWR